MLLLSKQLQSPQLDLQKACSMIQEVNAVLQEWRAEADNTFHRLFNDALRLCSIASVEMNIPRVASRQTARENYRTNSPEEYYRLSVFIPFLDHLVAEMAQRFSPLDGPCAELQQLVPTFMVQTQSAISLTGVLELYHNDLDQPSVVHGETSRWFQRWSNVARNDRPTNALAALWM